MKLSVRKLVFTALGLLAVVSILAISALVIDGLNDDLGKTDAAVVLGNAVDSQGKPSARLQARLDRAAELYQKGYFPLIIVSGGVGKEGFPEGSAMATYLISQGIPRDALVVDDLGIDTRATAVNSKAILDERNLRSVLVISQYFHIPRCQLALAKAGISEVRSAHAQYFEWRDLYSIAREIPAYIKYQFRQDY